MHGTDERIAAGRRHLTMLAARPRRGLESGGGLAPDLSRSRRRQSLEMLEADLARNVVENPATPLNQEASDAMQTLARSALEKMAGDGEEAALTPPEEMALEAVVKADGTRPSLLIRDGWVVTEGATVGDWGDEIANDEAAIRRAIASTGRLLVNGDTAETSVFGTAWMVAPGLAATAQHVVEALFAKVGDIWAPRFGFEITLDFGVEADRPARPETRVRVTGVERASPDMINNALNLANLDAAILALDLAGPSVPPPFTLASTLQPDGWPPQVHVIGHPFRPRAPDQPGVAPDEATVMTQQVLELVFGDVFGVKRWSPGLIVVGPGSLPADTHARVMTHDASTLGGSSGSPIFDLTEAPDRVVGLHYGGHFKKENFAHPCSCIREQLDLPGAIFVP